MDEWVDGKKEEYLGGQKVRRGKDNTLIAWYRCHFQSIRASEQLPTYPGSHNVDKPAAVVPVLINSSYGHKGRKKSHFQSKLYALDWLLTRPVFVPFSIITVIFQYTYALCFPFFGCFNCCSTGPTLCSVLVTPQRTKSQTLSARIASMCLQVRYD